MPAAAAAADDVGWSAVDEVVMMEVERRRRASTIAEIVGHSRRLRSPVLAEYSPSRSRQSPSARRKPSGTGSSLRAPSTTWSR